MKKLLAIVLLLCLVCHSAFAAGTLENLETRVVRIDNSGKFDIDVFVKVQNTGDAPVSLDDADIYLYDASGAVLEDSGIYSMYPPILQPGEVGYLTTRIYSVDAAVANAMSTYTINIKPEHSWLENVLHIAHEGTYAEVEYYSVSPIVTFTINNTSADTVWNLVTVTVVRSAEGKILAIDSNTIYDVGIPAGGTILYEMDLGSYNLEKWNEAGYTVGSVETYVYAPLD